MPRKAAPRCGLTSNMLTHNCHSPILIYSIRETLICTEGKLREAAINKNSKDVFSADKPLKNPADDQLGYARFAERLAKSIMEISPAEGYVISINGAWGLGKTTVLNFIQHYLDMLPEEERPLVVPFNPWMFSGHEDLIQRFFQQLKSCLKSSGLRMKYKVLIDKLADFSYLLSDAPNQYISFFSWFISKCLRRNKDIQEIKKAITEELREIQKPILFIIDDIDRLTSEEIRQLFKFIKAIAEFPYITYYLLSIELLLKLPLRNFKSLKEKTI